MSAGRPTRPRGVLALFRFRPSSPREADTRGVQITPGATAFARTPRGPSSTASDLTSATSAALAAPYAACRGAALRPLTDATKTSTPPPLAVIARPPTCAAR